MPSKTFLFEVCANSVESCLEAQIGGANRVELCAGIPEGGTTPSYGEILIARKLLTTTRLHVIIRPRGGDFLYSSLEIERMIADIKLCRELKVDGVVFGCLTPNGDIDIEKNKQLLAHCDGMSTTFHRAFDRTRMPFESLEQLISLKFDRVLTSGLQSTAEKGKEMLRQLAEKADNRIAILAGCGVNENNIRNIAQHSGVKEFHFSAREKMASNMQYIDHSVYMGAADADENSIEQTTRTRVKNTILALLTENK